MRGIGRTFAAAMIAAGLGGFVAPAEGRAAEVQGIGLQSDDPAFISLGAGGYDVLHNYTAGEFRAEYRSNYKLLGFLKPIVGGMVTTDRAFYGHAGFGIDIYFGSRWVLMPNAAVGFYERGAGKNLGSTIEFRTGAEFAYRFDDRSRLGLAFNHTSNAGIDKVNPGEESLVLVYSLPFSLLQ